MIIDCSCIFVSEVRLPGTLWDSLLYKTQFDLSTNYSAAFGKTTYIILSRTFFHVKYIHFTELLDFSEIIQDRSLFYLSSYSTTCANWPSRLWWKLAELIILGESCLENRFHTALKAVVIEYFYFSNDIEQLRFQNLIRFDIPTCNCIFDPKFNLGS